MSLGARLLSPALGGGWWDSLEKKRSCCPVDDVDAVMDGAGLELTLRLLRTSLPLLCAGQRHLASTKLWVLVDQCFIAAERKGTQLYSMKDGSISCIATSAAGRIEQ